MYKIQVVVMVAAETVVEARVVAREGAAMAAVA